MQWTVETGSSEGGAGGKTALVDEFEDCFALHGSTEGIGALENASARADASVSIAGASLAFFWGSSILGGGGGIPAKVRYPPHNPLCLRQQKWLRFCCLEAKSYRAAAVACRSAYEVLIMVVSVVPDVDVLAQVS